MPAPLESPPLHPPPTRRLKKGVRETDLLATDFDVDEAPADTPAIAPGKSQQRQAKIKLDPQTTNLFRQRLRLCCLIATVPFSLFFISGLTNSIELFGHRSVGWPCIVLCGVTLTSLLIVAGLLFRPTVEPTLRVLEVAVFGLMALFFAYWQFALLTAYPMLGFEGQQHEQSYVLAAAMTSHLNWFALIVFHGVLVPNSPSRGTGVALSMCATASSIDLVAVAVHVPAANAASMLFAISFSVLGAAIGLSVFGTAKTAALRREVETARAAVRQMGQYRLRRKLGSGGMGEVYLAEHRLLKRPCALKRIHAKYLNNQEQLSRFKREVQATARLRHPNTVEIYDYGIADDGTFYYVMEYLPGLSLEDMVARYGPLPPGRVVHLLRQACHALREAHRHGLVHRDIKPGNILVFDQGQPYDHVKLLDFGLVHSTTLDDEPAEKITREGLIVGTPEYMSPEQASGMQLDSRSDLFSLGSVAYFLLTGREAFHRENPMKTLMALVTEEPTRIQAMNPEVPDDLAAVITRCLAKDTSKRFDSAHGLEAALAICACADEWTEQLAVEWWQANPIHLPEGDSELEMTAISDGEGYFS